MNAPIDDSFHHELHRVVDRLRSMPVSQLERPWHGYASRAEGVRALAQWCVECTLLPASVGQPSVPNVGPLAVGDQLSVTCMDLYRAPRSPDVLAEAERRLRELRITL
ncbi:MAG: hypothetical protein WAO41_01790 [Candidatus Nanopelagicales bacterium]